MYKLVAVIDTGQFSDKILTLYMQDFQKNFMKGLNRKHSFVK
jgi:hypothetical protein